MNGSQERQTAARPEGGRWAVLFPGQGRQRQDMGKTLLSACPAAGEYLTALSAAAEIDLVELLCRKVRSNDPVTLHLAMMAFGLTAWKFLTEKEDTAPAFMAGHSLGELTALACAGVFTPEDALRLARARGECLAGAIKEHPGGMMALMGQPLEKLEQVYDTWRSSSDSSFALWKANYNSPGQLVVSGSFEALADLTLFTKQENVRTIPLFTAGPFHTPLMYDAARKFAGIAAAFPLQAPEIPVVSSLNGRLLIRWQGLPVHLALQMVQPVQWLATIHFLRQAQVGRLLEVSSGQGVLSGLARQTGSWKVESSPFQ